MPCRCSALCSAAGRTEPRCGPSQQVPLPHRWHVPAAARSSFGSSSTSSSPPRSTVHPLLRPLDPFRAALHAPRRTSPAFLGSFCSPRCDESTAGRSGRMRRLPIELLPSMRAPAVSPGWVAPGWARLPPPARPFVSATHAATTAPEHPMHCCKFALARRSASAWHLFHCKGPSRSPAPRNISIRDVIPTLTVARPGRCESGAVAAGCCHFCSQLRLCPCHLRRHARPRCTLFCIVLLCKSPKLSAKWREMNRPANDPPPPVR